MRDSITSQWIKEGKFLLKTKKINETKAQTYLGFICNNLVWECCINTRLSVWLENGIEVKRVKTAFITDFMNSDFMIKTLNQWCILKQEIISYISFSIPLETSLLNLLVVQLLNSMSSIAAPPPRSLVRIPSKITSKFLSFPKCKSTLFHLSLWFPDSLHIFTIPASVWIWMRYIYGLSNTSFGKNKNTKPNKTKTIQTQSKTREKTGRHPFCFVKKMQRKHFARIKRKAVKLGDYHTNHININSRWRLGTMFMIELQNSPFWWSLHNTEICSFCLEYITGFSLPF